MVCHEVVGTKMRITDELAVHNDQNQPVSDNDYVALFFLLGFSSNISGKTFLNAIDIFDHYCNTDNMGMIYNKVEPILESIALLIFVIVKPKKPIPILLVGIAFQLIILLSYPTLLIVNHNTHTQYIITIVIFSLIGFFSMMTLCNARNFASRFEHSSYTFMSSGYGCCGIVIASLRMSAKSAFSDESQTTLSSTSYFFLIAIILLVIFVYLLYKFRDYSIKNRFINSIGFDVIPFSIHEYLDLLKEIWMIFLPLILNAFITISLFPGYLTRVHGGADIGTWTPVIITSLFCIFDLVGEALAVQTPCFYKFFDLILAFIRASFYPIFIISIQNVFSLGEPVWTFCWTIIFSLTNGYIRVHAVKNIMAQVQDQQANLQYQINFLVSISICIGTIGGSCLTYAF